MNLIDTPHPTFKRIGRNIRDEMTLSNGSYIFLVFLFYLRNMPNWATSPIFLSFNSKHLWNYHFDYQNYHFLLKISQGKIFCFEFLINFHKYTNYEKLFKASNCRTEFNMKVLNILKAIAGAVDVLFPQSTIKLLWFHVAITSQHLTFCSHGNYSSLPLNIKASYYSSLYQCIYLSWQISKSWFFSLLQIKPIFLQKGRWLESYFGNRIQWEKNITKQL